MRRKSNVNFYVLSKISARQLPLMDHASGPGKFDEINQSKKTDETGQINQVINYTYPILSDSSNLSN